MLLLIPVVFTALLGWFELNPRAAEMTSAVGSEAHELLGGFPDGRLVIEVAYQSSAGPPPGSALAILEQRVNETCTKSSVQFEVHGFSSAAGTFADSDLLSLESSERQNWPTPGSMSLFYLYLGGSYTPDSAAIGLAYRGSSIAVFEGTITATSPSETAAVVATVMVHEFGHELGLVGLVGPAPNEDAQHPYHSNDPSDVMYWAVDSTALLLGGLLGGATPPTRFNAADLSDLSTVRSSVIPAEWIPVIGTVVPVTAAAIAVAWGRRKRRELDPGRT